MKAQLLPPSFLRLVSPADRKALGLSTMTAEETLAKQEVKSERDLHKLVRGLLGLRGIEFIESRMDRRTTQKKGVPDFLFAIKDEAIDPKSGAYYSNIYAVAWECKIGKERPSDEQQRMAIRMSTPPNAWIVKTIYSLEQAIYELQQLGL